MALYLNNSTPSSIEFFVADAATGLGVAGIGAGFAAGELKIGKNDGAALANIDTAGGGVVAERGNGSYVYRPTAAELDTLGDLVFRQARAGAIVVLQREEVRLPEWRGKVAAGTLTSSAFTTNRTEATDGYWKDCLIEFLTGANAGQVKPVGGYTGATKLVTLVAGYAFTSAPLANDQFRFISR